MSSQQVDSSYQIQAPIEDPVVKQRNWDMAVGLNLVDNLTPSAYLQELIGENVAGKIDYGEVEQRLQTYYQAQDTTVPPFSNERECDLVATRIAALLADESFVFSPVTLKNIHAILFAGIYDFAGQCRDYNIMKAEPILRGASVNYAPHQQIQATLTYDFDEEMKIKYAEMVVAEQLQQLAKFISAIWQVHPFAEGNTRTTAVFAEKYLRSLGFVVDYELFKDQAVYFRAALVRDNYTDVGRNINATDKYLILFLENLLVGKKNALVLSDLTV